MSQADILLNGLTDKEMAVFSVRNGSEEHIVIGNDRRIIVPESLRRLAVQHDHNIETVTFDCPRYWDDHDMSEMVVYINYKLSNGVMGAYIADAVTADGDIMHFSWTIKREVSDVAGFVTFLVCVKKTDGEGNEVNHWNSELCKDCYISEGMECADAVPEQYPALVTDLLERMGVVEQINIDAQTMEELLELTTEQATKAQEEAAIAVESREALMSKLSRSEKVVKNLRENWGLEELRPESNTSYIRSVPSGMLPHAEVTEVGGMTYVEDGVMKSAAVTAIESVGKNLAFNRSGYVTSDYNGMTITRIEGSSRVVVNGTATKECSTKMFSYFKLPAGTYTVSVEGLNANDRLFIAVNGGDILANYIQTGAPKTITISEEKECYIELIFTSGSAYSNAEIKAMLNAGSSALPYEPYTKHTLDIPAEVQALDGWGLGIDSECHNRIVWDPERGVKQYRQEVGIIDMGTLTFTYRESNGRNIFGAYVTNIRGFVAGDPPLPAVAVGYRAAKVGDTWVDGDMAYGNSAIGYNKIEFVNNAYTDVESFTSAMRGRYLVYALATPIVTDLQEVLPDDNFVEVEEGGMITAVNEHGCDVPMTLAYSLKARGVSMTDIEWLGGTSVTRNKKLLENMLKNFAAESFSTDNAVGYSKAVPAMALPHAEVKEIGGMTYVEDGEIKNAAVTAIESVGANILKHTLDIPTEVQALEDYGLGINETCYNRIVWDPERNVKQYRREVGLYAFTGEEPFANWVGGGEFIGVTVDDFIPYDASPGSDIRGVCNDFDVVVDGGTATRMLGLRQGSETGLRRVYLRDSAIASKEAWISYFADKYAAGNPVVLVYKLATPEVIDLTDILPDDNFIEVEGNGTVTAVNEHGCDVPTTIKYQLNRGL